MLERLDKAYDIDYARTKNVSVEYFISGLYTREDKIAELNLNDKLKGHLLLLQANLSHNDRNVIVGAACGNYDESTISSALCNMFRNSTPYETS